MTNALGELGRFAEPALYILVSLSDGPKHGYAIMTDVEAVSGAPMGPGTLYGALARLERRGPDRGARAGRAPAAVPADRPRGDDASGATDPAQQLRPDGAGSPRTQTVMSRLVRLYPAAWRERYEAGVRGAPGGATARHARTGSTSSAAPSTPTSIRKSAIDARSSHRPPVDRNVRIVRRLGFGALAGAGLWVVGWIVVWLGPVRYDGDGAYRDGGAACAIPPRGRGADRRRSRWSAGPSPERRPARAVRRGPGAAIPAAVGDPALAGLARRRDGRRTGAPRCRDVPVPAPGRPGRAWRSPWVASSSSGSWPTATRATVDRMAGGVLLTMAADSRRPGLAERGSDARATRSA